MLAEKERKGKKKGRGGGHEKPDARKVLEVRELARAFVYSLGVEDWKRGGGEGRKREKEGAPDSYCQSL